MFGKTRFVAVVTVSNFAWRKNRVSSKTLTEPRSLDSTRGIILPLKIPEAMELEHEELHGELRKDTRIPGKVGKAAKQVAQVLHPHFKRENELALPLIGVARELAEAKTSADFPKAMELFEKFEPEYEKMLQEHLEIVKALDELEEAAKKAKKVSVIDFVRKLKLHARIEEDLTYPAALMVGKLLKQEAIHNRGS
jgi:hypothetical protein